jgi:site-specific recombinase XerD
VGDLRPATVQPLLEAAYDGRSQATRCRYYSTVRAFAAWLITQGLVAADPIAGIPPPRPASFDPRPLRGNHVVAALIRGAQTPSTRSRSAWPARDTLLIAVLATTAIRASEAAEAMMSDIDGPPFERVLRVSGKGGRIRYVPLVDEIDNYLDAYLAERARRLGQDEQHRDDAPLFVRRFGGAMTRSELANIVRRSARAAGVEAAFPDGAHLHAFRHRVATDLLREGANVLDVQQLLGHSSLQMAQRYLAITGSELRQAVSRLPARSDLAHPTTDE